MLLFCSQLHYSIYANVFSVYPPLYTFEYVFSWKVTRSALAPTLFHTTIHCWDFSAHTHVSFVFGPATVLLPIWPAAWLLNWLCLRAAAYTPMLTPMHHKNVKHFSFLLCLFGVIYFFSIFSLFVVVFNACFGLSTTHVFRISTPISSNFRCEFSQPHTYLHTEHYQRPHCFLWSLTFFHLFNWLHFLYLVFRSKSLNCFDLLLLQLKWVFAFFYFILIFFYFFIMLIHAYNCFYAHSTI